jgi:hypothetical protein
VGVQTSDDARRSREGRACWPEEGVAELTLLLPARQAAELERLARSRGLTLGQLLRRLVRDHLARGAAPAPR